MDEDKSQILELLKERKWRFVDNHPEIPFVADENFVSTTEIEAYKSQLKELNKLKELFTSLSNLKENEIQEILTESTLTHQNNLKQAITSLNQMKTMGQQETNRLIKEVKTLLEQNVQYAVDLGELLLRVDQALKLKSEVLMLERETLTKLNSKLSGA